MSFTNEANAGFRITGITGLKTLLGKIRATVEKLIEREEIMADDHNTPYSRPVDLIDARFTAQCLDTAAGFDETASPANITVAFGESGGGSGSVVIGPMVGGSTRHGMGRRQGGFSVEVEAMLQGSALTYTPTA